METVSVFAATSSTPESVIARVRADVARDCAADVDVCPPFGEIDRLVDEAVRDLWRGPVKTFVHVLAVRQVREAFDRPLPGPRTPSAPARRATAPRDIPVRDPDQLMLDRRDALRSSDDVSV